MYGARSRVGAHEALAIITMTKSRKTNGTGEYTKAGGEGWAESGPASKWNSLKDILWGEGATAKSHCSYTGSRHVLRLQNKNPVTKSHSIHFIWCP